MMKNLFTSICFALISKLVFCQSVFIPDNNLRAILINKYPECVNFNASLPAFSNIQVNCSSIQLTESLNLANYAIQDLTGLQYFTNLKSLSLAGNPILKMVTLPRKLEYLDLTTTLFQRFTINYPPNLKTLIARNNDLSFFPTGLPNSIENLRLDNNNIIYIDNLPTSTKIFTATYNNLLVFDNMPASLRQIDISYNDKLSYLPEFPNEMQLIYAKRINLTSFPSSLPDSLINLNLTLNCFNSFPGNPNPTRITQYDVLPNLSGCGIPNGIVENNTIESFQAMPNPTSNILYFDNRFLDSSLKIYDALGIMVVDENKLTNNDFDLSRFNLQDGVYSIVIQKEDIFYRSKFIKSN